MAYMNPQSDQTIYQNEHITFSLDDTGKSIIQMGWICSLKINGNTTYQWTSSNYDTTYEHTFSEVGTFVCILHISMDVIETAGWRITINVIEPPSFSTLSLNNKEVKSLIINNKEVQSIVRVSDGCVLYEKHTPPILITSVSLTEANNKTVISARTSETAVFTATALDSNNNPVSGVSMVIKVDGTTVKTEATDSNGQVSYTYTAVGTGDVSISAECMSVIETYSIEDCYEIIPSPNSKGFSSQWYQSPVKITGEMIRKGSWGGTRIYGSSNATSVDRNYIFLSQNSGNANESEKIRYNVPSSWFNFEVHVGNGSASLYVNNSLINTVQVDTSGYVMISGGSNANPITMGNVKIKPL